MIEIILHDICDTFPYLKYGLAAAVCTALALTVLKPQSNHGQGKAEQLCFAAR